MFYDVYCYLCETHGEKPYALPLKLGAKSNSVVAQWEKGSIPRRDMLQKIAEYFGVTVGYLMDGQDLSLNLSRTNSMSSDMRSISAENSTDSELDRYLEALRSRPEMRMLFSVTEAATKEDVERAVAIIEALRKAEDR